MGSLPVRSSVTVVPQGATTATEDPAQGEDDRVSMTGSRSVEELHLTG